MAGSCRVYDVSQNTAKIIFVSLSMTQPTATCSGGNVSVSQITDWYGQGGKNIGVSLITITGLSPWAEYTYTITQGGETLDGSFRTMPADQNTDFGFLVSTCENYYHRDPHNVYAAIRQLMRTAQEPIVTLFHIDDLNYFDGMRVNDSVTGISNTEPQTTGNTYDYAAAYAAYYGLLPSFGNLQQADRLWLFRNLPCCASGGDHMFEGNHCRGGIGNSDYKGCNRLATDPVPNLEANAKAVWDAFVGDANPAPLRAGKLHWGKDIGPVRFALFDYSLYAQPYDPAAPDPNLVGYGSEQINDVMTWMDVNSHQFKCFLHESGLCAYGQPWRDWHPNEADGWKTQHDAAANLNGTSGNSFTVYGDNHAPHVVKYDTMWAFCAGVLRDSQVVNQNPQDENRISKVRAWGVDSKLVWSWNAYAKTGDKKVGGFWYFRVLASQSPRVIEAYFIDSNGNIRSGAYRLVEGTVNNQWAPDKSKVAI